MIWPDNSTKIPDTVKVKQNFAHFNKLSFHIFYNTYVYMCMYVLQEYTLLLVLKNRK
jgi:hypothetical protein